MIKDMLHLVIHNYDLSKLSQNNRFEVIYNKTVNQRRTFDFKHLYPFEVPNDIQASQDLTKQPIQSQYQQQDLLPRIRAKESNLLDFYQNLKKVLDTYPYTDHDPFYAHLEKIFSKLLNINQIKNKEKEPLVNSLKLIANSRLIYVFFEESWFARIESITEQLSNSHCTESIKT